MANISKTDLTKLKWELENSFWSKGKVNEIVNRLELAGLILKAYGSDSFDDAYAVHEKIQKMLI